MKSKYYFAILKNENENDHIPWVKSCEKNSEQVAYKVIDITKSNWLELIFSENFDFYLTRPPDKTEKFKQLYDERVTILNSVFKSKLYPTLTEILLYENKRMLAYWLEANKIPHPLTRIFYTIEEASEFIEKNKEYPVVAKTSIGASGSGVKIIRNKNEALKYLTDAFSKNGVKRKWGPNFRKSEIFKRSLKRISNPVETIKYFINKKAISETGIQFGYVIFQKYIKCDFEWRAVKVGNSYFAHKKLRSFGELMSGTSKVSWDPPNERFLDFIESICNKGGFYSQAVDVFEDQKGNYFVNELQCFFGSKNPYQMIVNNKPGRYIKKDSSWIFEEGNFNTNNSYDLRLKHIIQLLSE